MASPLKVTVSVGQDLCAAFTPTATATAGRAAAESEKSNFSGILSLLAGFGNASNQNEENGQKTATASESLQPQDAQDADGPHATPSRSHAAGTRPGKSRDIVVAIDMSVASALVSPLLQPVTKQVTSPEAPTADEPNATLAQADAQAASSIVPTSTNVRRGEAAIATAFPASTAATGPLLGSPALNPGSTAPLPARPTPASVAIEPAIGSHKAPCSASEPIETPDEFEVSPRFIPAVGKMSDAPTDGSTGDAAQATQVNVPQGDSLTVRPAAAIPLAETAGTLTQASLPLSATAAPAVDVKLALPRISDGISAKSNTSKAHRVTGAVRPQSGHAEHTPAADANPVLAPTPAIQDSEVSPPASNARQTESSDVDSGAAAPERGRTVPLDLVTRQMAPVNPASKPPLPDIAFTARLTPPPMARNAGSGGVPTVPANGDQTTQPSSPRSNWQDPTLSTSGGPRQEHADVPHFTAAERTAAEPEASMPRPNIASDDRGGADSERARPRTERPALEAPATIPDRGIGQAAQAWNMQGVDSRPQQAGSSEHIPTQASEQPKTIYPAHEATPPATPPHGSVRTLDFQLDSASGRVAMRVADRAGEVKVDVRTADPSLSGTLRSGLPELTARMEQAGFHAEIWHPGSAAVSDRKDSVEPAVSVRTSSDESHRDNGQRQEERRQAAEPQQPPPRKQNRKDFQWLFTSIR